jgi:hypothetical protein
MTGAQALVYARSRHTSIDYDRAQRQQRVLVSLKEQTDVNTIIPQIPSLISALKQTVHTDIPISQLPNMLELAGSVDTTNIRSYVFSPPLYGQEVVSSACGDSNTINVNKVRQAVKNAFSTNPADEALREKNAAEEASVWVLNGSGQTGQASGIAAYLDRSGPAEHHHRRLQRGRVERPRDRRLSPAAVQCPGHACHRPDRPGGHRHHDIQGDPGPHATTGALTARGLSDRRLRRCRKRSASAGALPDQPASLIGVSQWRYSGNRPRTASK